MNVLRTGLVAALALLTGCASVSLGRVDHDNALREQLTPRAEQGDTQAQFDLGEAWCCGTGFYSTEEALKWWCRAAASGHEGALRKLKEMLAVGMEEGCRKYDSDRDSSFEASR